MTDVDLQKRLSRFYDELHPRQRAPRSMTKHLLDREIVIKIAPRDDGGLRVWSDDLPGLILSHSNPWSVLHDLGNAIAALLRYRNQSE